jgi:hypothetical protein
MRLKNLPKNFTMMVTHLEVNHMNLEIMTTHQNAIQKDFVNSRSRGLAPIPLQTQTMSNDAKWLGFSAFVLGLALGAYLTLHLHYMSYDAVSRVAHAFFVLWSRDPHLGAIGFVWTPLSSILSLPIVVFYPLWPQLVREGIAGIPVSALFSGIGTYYLTKLLIRFNIPQPWRTGMVLIYMLNPMILLYSANGMTDGMLAACVIATYYGVFTYLQVGSLKALTSAAFWLVVGLGVRYEAIPFGIMVALGVAISQIIGRESWSVIRGTGILLLAPLTAGGALWLYFNWLIMKNPFYFLDGTYSNIAQTKLSGYEQYIRTHEMSHPINSLLYISHFTLFFWPLILGIAMGIFLLGRRGSDTFVPVVLGGLIGPLLLDFTLLLKGNLAPWDRYFIYYIPTGFVLVCYIAAKIAHIFPRLIKRPFLGWGLITLLLLSGSFGTYYALQTSQLGSPDGAIVRMALENKSMTSITPGSLALIRFMNHHPHMIVLTDDFTTGVPVVIQVNNPRQFIITSDYDYKSILLNPRGRASAFLVPQPTGAAGHLVDINRYYPTMWYGKVSWVHLIRQFNNVDGTSYRLYGIDSTAP